MNTEHFIPKPKKCFLLLTQEGVGTQSMQNMGMVPKACRKQGVGTQGVGTQKLYGRFLLVPLSA